MVVGAQGSGETRRINAILEIVFAEYPELAEQLFVPTASNVAARSASVVPEELTGESSALVPIKFLEAGLRAARPVGLVFVDGRARGTGFLLREDLFVTCYHVLEIQKEDLPLAAMVRFHYDTAYGETPVYDYEVERPVSYSPRSGGFDFTIVKLKGRPSEVFGYLPITKRRAKHGERVNIIQHAGGGVKQMSYFHNLVVASGDVWVDYKTDTLGGSSGSPVFDKEWHVVALHQGARAADAHHSKRNVGLHIEIIVDALAQQGFKTLGHDANANVASSRV